MILYKRFTPYHHLCQEDESCSAKQAFPYSPGMAKPGGGFSSRLNGHCHKNINEKNYQTWYFQTWFAKMIAHRFVHRNKQCKIHSQLCLLMFSRFTMCKVPKPHIRRRFKERNDGELREATVLNEVAMSGCSKGTWIGGLCSTLVMNKWWIHVLGIALTFFFLFCLRLCCQNWWGYLRDY